MSAHTDKPEQLLDRAFTLVEAGNLTGARALFAQVIRQDAGNAEAWMMQGSIDAESGKSDEALRALQRALQLDPDMPEAHYYLGSLHHSSGNAESARVCIEKSMALDTGYAEAFLLGGAIYAALNQPEQSEQCYRRVTELAPASADAHLGLGHALMHRGAVSEACQQAVTASQLQPDSLPAWTLLGRAHARLADPEKSASAYQKALDLDPNCGEACYGLGSAAFQQHRYSDAAAYYSRALTFNTTHADAASNLGRAYQAMGRYEEALTAFDRALAVQPDLVEALFGKASVLIEFTRRPEAMTCLRRILQLQPDAVAAYTSLASILMTYGKPEEALEQCEKALQIQPDNIDAIAVATRIEQHAGQVEKAYRRLKPLIDSGVEQASIAIAFGEVCSSMNCPEEAIGPLEKLLAGQHALPYVAQCSLHFGLGNLYAKVADHEKAFASYRAGNALRASVVKWDPEVNRSLVDSIIQAFSKAYLETAPRATLHSQKPVFVLGMPRSGTSLVEQVLASHPAVFGAGELPDIWRMVQNLPVRSTTDPGFPHNISALNPGLLDERAKYYLSLLDELSADAQRVVDKMPGNFRYIGLIELLFPEARVIHCVRDPVDTCLSCYFQDFSGTQPYSCDLEHLGLYHRNYQRLMAHWKETLSIPILDVSYEEMVNDQEAVSRRMIEFCGLDWDDSCLQFHRAERFVATASYDQVRRPIYSSSVRRWEKYKKHLGPLIDALQ